MPDDGIDVRIRLRDKRQFVSDTTSTAGAIEKIGKTSVKSNDTIRRSSKVGVGALRKLAGAAIAVGVAYIGIGAAKSAIDTTIGLTKATVALHRNLGLSNKVASEWAAAAKARGVDTSTLSLSFTNLSKNVEAALGGTRKEIATSRARSVAAARDLRTIQGRIVAFKAQQTLQLAAVRGDRAETASVRARGVVQLAALKREETLAKARANTNKVTLKALAGNKQAVSMFRKLGISQDDLRRGSHDFQFLLGRIADGLKALPPGTQKAAIAQKLLGRSSQLTLPIFTQGAKVMNENLQLADKYGVTLSKNPLKALRQLQHAQKELEFAQLGWQVTFATKIAPALTKLILLVTRGSQWLQKHKTAAKLLIGTVLVLGTAFGIAAATTAILESSLVVATAGALGFDAALAANPIVLIVLALVALVAGLIYAYRHFETFRNIINGTFDWIKGHWQLLLVILTGPIGAAALFVIDHWNGIVSFFRKLPGRISRAASGMWGGVKSEFFDLLKWMADKWNAIAGPLHLPKIHAFDVAAPPGALGPTKPEPHRRGAGGPGGVLPPAGASKQVQSLPAGADGAAFSVQVPVVIDGREVARAVHTFDLGELARA